MLFERRSIFSRMDFINFAKVERETLLSEVSRGVGVILVCLAAVFDVISLKHFFLILFFNTRKPIKALFSLSICLGFTLCIPQS